MYSLYKVGTFMFPLLNEIINEYVKNSLVTGICFSQMIKGKPVKQSKYSPKVP